MHDQTRQFRVATYNIHRWGGRTGRTLVPAQAAHVIRELNADILALQEVLLPWGDINPLAHLASTLDMNVIFGATRLHRHGLLGNALLSRWHAHHTEQLPLSQTRWEYRGAVLGCYQPWEGLELSVIATHLALGGRARNAQVRWLLNHPCLQRGPVVLLGDLNSWRPTRGTRQLARMLEAHPRRLWPRTFPSPVPFLALDRIYTRELNVVNLRVHSTPAARRGSDHLPVVAHMAA